MAEDQLKFEVGINSINIDAIKESWKAEEAKIQKILDDNNLSIKIKGFDIASFEKGIQNASSGMSTISRAAQIASTAIKDASTASKELNNVVSGTGITEKITMARTGINAAKAELAELERIWNSMSTEEKFIGGDALKGYTSNAQAVIDMYNEIRSQSQTLYATLSDLEKQDAARVKASEREKAAAYKQREKEITAVFNEQAKAQEKIAAAKAKEEAKSSKLLSDLKLEENTRENINKKLQAYQTIYNQSVRGSKQFEDARTQILRLSAEYDKLSISQQRSSRETTNITTSLFKQSGLMNGVAQWINSYVSVLGALRLAKNIRDITSEFELQRVALGAIMQDTVAADQLFEKIKRTAIESPFATKDLVTYTKQLAAYRIENDKLYDTMNMLADVSAGLGVDMNRLILAYGQVKAASVLRGQELRQFTEAGIPLVELLADKFSQLRGEIVSTGDVFKLISDRAVPFKMVEEIFNDMTSAGGKFYDMQKIQAKTLHGIYENLGDNVQVAFDKLGRQNRGLLVNIGQSATYLAQNLSSIADTLEVVLAGLIAYKVALMLASKEAATLNTVETLNIATKAKNVALTNAQVFSLRTAVRAKNLYTAATIKAETATNIFSKALYKLIAALIANPFAAVAAAIAGIGAAIYKITKNANDASAAVERLNEQTARVESFNKMSKTISDLSRLKASNAELQKQANYIVEIGRAYPSAVEEVDKYGKAVKVNMELVKQLRDAELKGIEASARKEKDRVQKLKDKTDKELTRLQKQLKSPGVTMTGLFGQQWSSTLDTSKISEQVSALQNKSATLGDAIDELNSLLGENKSDTEDAANATSKFSKRQQEVINYVSILQSKWSKLQTSYSRANLPTITDSETQLKDFAATVANEYKELSETIAYEKGLPHPDTATIKNMEVYLGFLKQIGKQVNADFGEKSSTSSVSSSSDILSTRLSNLKAAYKAYEDALKYMTKSDAAKSIKSIYDIDIDADKYVAELKKIAAEYRALGKEKEAANIDLTIANFDAEREKAAFQSKLDALAKKISQTKEAASFFDTIFSGSGDRELSTALTLSLTGINVNTGDVRDALVEQLQASFGDIHIDTTLTVTGQVDYAALAEKISALPESTRAAAEKALAALIEYDKSALSELFSAISKNSTFEAQEQAIKERYARLMKTAVESGLGTSALEAAMQSEIDDARWETYKRTTDYTSLFEDMERKSTVAISNMLTNLTNLKSSLSSLPPEALRDITRQIETLRQKLIERNPFEAIITNFKNLIAARKDFDRLGGFTRLNELETKKASGKTLSEKELADLRALKEAADNAQASFTDLSSGLSAASTAVGNISSAFGELSSLITSIVDEDSDVADFLSSMESGIKVISTLLGALLAGLVAVDTAMKLLESSNPLGWILSATAAVAGLIAAITSIGKKRLQRSLESSERVVENLQKAYTDLESEMDKALGDEKIAKVKEMVSVLEQENAKLREQEEIQRKLKNTSAIDDIEDQIKENINSIEQAYQDLVDYFAGSSLTSAAESFADSWLEAYLSFNDTKAALESSMQDMIKNFISKSVIAKVMETALSGVYGAIEQYAEGKVGVEGVLAEYNLLISQIPELDSLLRGLYERMGFSLAQIGELSGLSQGISTASEDSINALTGAVNSQLYYQAASYNVLISILDILQAKYSAALSEAAGATSGTTNSTLLAVQQNALSVITEIRDGVNSGNEVRKALYDIIESASVQGGKRAINMRLIE